MGCVFSSPSLHCGKPGLYRVHNVDDQGREVSEGFIDIADAELILYQRGKEPIRWPLRCLRRYGYEAELFSFESGRRCPTGAGIYAFKCRRAESLFTNLQESIMRSGQDDSHRYNPSNSLLTQTNRNSVVSHQNYTELTTCTTGTTNTFPVQAGAGTDRHQYVNGDIETIPNMMTSLVVELPDHDYENAEMGADNLPLRFDGHNTDEDAVPYENVPAVDTVYCNVNTDKQTSRIVRVNQPPPIVHNYANTDAIVANGASGGGPIGGTGGDSVLSNGCIDDQRKMNYIQLDLDRRGSEGSSIPSTSPTSPTSLTSCPASPGRTSGGDQYAAIDFTATAALSFSARVSVDEGSRRTRHSSSIMNDCL